MTSQKRILFVTHGTGLYGSDRSMLLLISKLDRSRYAPFVLLKARGPLSAELDRIGVPTIIYPTKQWVAFPHEYSRWHFREVFFGMPKRVRDICDLIKKENIDLVYTNSLLTIDGAVAAKVKGIPHVMHVHEIVCADPFLKPYLPIPIVNQLVKLLSKKIIAVSHAVKRSLGFPQKGKYNGKIDVIYNGIDIKAFKEPRIIGARGANHDLRKMYHIAEKTKLVGLIGRYDESKGVGDLIEAARIVSGRADDVKFIIVGSGSKDLLKRWQRKSRELSLEDRFLFLDFQKDLVPVYEAIDILVLASWVEACPLTVLEGMAMGKPIVATRCGGAEESVIDGETGFLVPIRSPSVLAGAVKKLLVNQELAEKMGACGQKRASQLFNSERYTVEIERVIGSILQNGK